MKLILSDYRTNKRDAIVRWHHYPGIFEQTGLP